MGLNKFATFDQYPPRSLEKAEAALLTVWRSLEMYHDELVLIGGLAVRYLTKRDVPGLPGAVTMDVDLAVALGAEGRQYGTIGDRLSGLGFICKDSRFVREEKGASLYVDLLTEVPGEVTGGVIVDGAPASVAPGLNRALACHRAIEIRGTDLYGVEQTCSLRVADIGPMLVLKLNAFGGPTARRQPKDAYDVLLAVTGFIDGAGAALAGFKAEKAAGNPAMDSALSCLEREFQSEERDGPARAAEFHPGGKDERERVRQDMVTVGRALLNT